MDKFIESELEGFCESSPLLNMPESLDRDVKLNESITDTIMKSVKKTEHILLLVVQPELYETFAYDYHMQESYVAQQLAPWHENTLVEPYVVLSKEEAIEEYEENAKDYPNKDEYYMKYHGGYLNENGEVVSQINENGKYSTYNIKYSGLEVGDIMNMILSGEITFRYIIHNGQLCDKEDDESINALSNCDQNSYFIVISCTE